MSDLAALPKAHLHLHLEGSMRPSTLAELCARYAVAEPTIEGFGDFSAFAATYMAACAVLRTDEDLARLATEVVDDAADAGAVWLEPAFHPGHHRVTLGPDDHTVAIVLDALHEAAARRGIAAGLMVAADRTKTVADAVALAHTAAAHIDDGVVAFGLANDEVIGPPEPFAPAFAVAADAGLLCTPHAGELCGPESVRDALDALRADRIQHGVRAIEDPALVKRLADDGVCLDVCPTSNRLLSVVDAIEDHPLPHLLAAGVRCSINADDSLLFGSGLLEEYELCRDVLGLDDRDLASVARSSVVASGAPADVRAVALAGIDAWGA
jgi:adenosine deaminase